MEVIAGDIAHQRRDHGLAVLFGVEEIGARGFGGAAQPSPDIDFKREEVEAALAPVAILIGHERSWQWRLAIARQAREFEICRWQLTCGNWFERVMPRLARASSTRATASRRS